MLKEIRIKNLYGEINISEVFNDDLNILIGKNGSGKTTVLNILNYISEADFERLIVMEFSSIEIIFNSKKKDRIFFRLEKQKNGIIVSLDNRTVTLMGELNAHNGLYRNFATKDGKSYIRRNRSNYIVDDESVFAEILNELKKEFEVSYIPLNRTLNGSSDSLSSYNLDEVKELVGEEYKKVLSGMDRISNNFKKRVISNTFSLSSGKNSISNIDNLQSIKLDTVDELKKTLSEINILDKEIEASLDSYFTKFFYVQEGLKEFLDTKNELDLTKLLRNRKKFEEFSQILMNGSQTELIFSLIGLVKEINASRAKQFSKLFLFESIINSFFVENDKRLRISSSGNIIIEKLISNNRKKNIKLENLSSGEKQLVTLFALFIFKYNKSNILFLIDEPELSLHLSWQEKFCKSLFTILNDNQFVIATHSPEIVGGYRNRCIRMGEL